MESDFTKMRKKRMKMQRNVVIAEIIVYIAAVVMLFGYGGRLAELSTMIVPTISIDGIIKIISIFCFLILAAIVFIPGPLVLWVTKDGTLVKIGDMADDHLINSVAILKRMTSRMRFNYDFSAYSMLRFCNGEMAQDALESELFCDAQMSNEEWLESHTSYGELMEEAIRRNIVYMIGASFFSYMDRYIEMVRRHGDTIVQ